MCCFIFKLSSLKMDDGSTKQVSGWGYISVGGGVKGKSVERVNMVKVIYTHAWK
jgi:hypothetical protein